MQVKEIFLAEARHCFRRASETDNLAGVTMFAEMGRDFLKCAMRPPPADTVAANDVAPAGAALLRNGSPAGNYAQKILTLTKRETEIFRQIASGLSSKEIARSCGISPRTVDVHRDHIKEKLEARSALDLVRIYYHWING
jgi:DNA-binding CsgD family transcriptional regulator